MCCRTGKLSNSYNHIVTKYALLCFVIVGSICHLAPFEKPTDCINLKSFPKSPRKLLISLMYSLTDVSLFYHYNNQWAPVYHLYISQAMRYVRHNETPNGFSQSIDPYPNQNMSNVLASSCFALNPPYKALGTMAQEVGKENHTF